MCKYVGGIQNIGIGQIRVISITYHRISLFGFLPNPILQVMVDFIWWNKTLQSEK